MNREDLTFGLDSLPPGVEPWSVVALLGTWWGAGLVAPFRSFLAILSVLLLLLALPVQWRARAALALWSMASLFGLFVGRFWSQATGITDDNRIVIDEIAGALVAVAVNYPSQDTLNGGNSIDCSPPSSNWLPTSPCPKRGALPPPSPGRVSRRLRVRTSASSAGGPGTSISLTAVGMPRLRPSTLMAGRSSRSSISSPTSCVGLPMRCSRRHHSEAVRIGKGTRSTPTGERSPSARRSRKLTNMCSQIRCHTRARLKSGRRRLAGRSSSRRRTASTSA